MLGVWEELIPHTTFKDNTFLSFSWNIIQEQAARKAQNLVSTRREDGRNPLSSNLRILIPLHCPLRLFHLQD